MTPRTPRADLIAIIDAEQDFWRSIVQQVPSAMNDVPINGDWTFRDLMAHLLAWRSWGLARMRSALDGEPEPPPPYPAHLSEDDDADLDAINAWFHARDRERDVFELAEDFAASFDDLRDIVSGMSDAELDDPRLFPHFDGQSLRSLIANGAFFEHTRDEHRPELEALLKGNWTGVA
jgi:hypothetical protein